MITNTGGPPLVDFEHASDANWDDAYQSILVSCVQLIKAALPHLRQSDAASILTITSVAAKQPMSGFLLSNVVRPAILGLTKSLSQELGPDNIRVNSILPGYTMTERLKQALRYHAAQNNTSFEEEVKKITDHLPLRRMADPKEFARAASFLVSPAASYVTGTMLQVDGGFCAGLF